MDAAALRDFEQCDDTGIRSGVIQQVDVVIVHEQIVAALGKMHPLWSERPLDQHPGTKPDQLFHLRDG